MRRRRWRFERILYSILESNKFVLVIDIIRALMQVYVNMMPFMYYHRFHIVLKWYLIYYENSFFMFID